MDVISNLVHLVWEAPGSGTELGKLQIRNSESMRRAVFFNGPHCVIAPMYCKTRNMRGGRVIPLTRYLDVSSTRVLKLVFAVVYPWVMILESISMKREARERERLFLKEKISLEDIKKLRQDQEQRRNYLTNFLCMSKQKSESIAALVGRVMKKHNLPVNFSTYRH